MRVSPAWAFSSLASRLIGLIVVVGLLAGSLVGIVALQQSRSAMRGEILQRSLAAADLAAALTAEYFAQTEADARELAARPGVIKAVDSNDTADLTDDLEGWLSEHPHVQGAATFDFNGKVLASGHNDAPTVRISYRADTD